MKMRRSKLGSRKDCAAACEDHYESQRTAVFKGKEPPAFIIDTVHPLRRSETTPETSNAAVSTQAATPVPALESDPKGTESKTVSTDFHGICAGQSQSVPKGLQNPPASRCEAEEEKCAKTEPAESTRNPSPQTRSNADTPSTHPPDSSAPGTTSSPDYLPTIIVSQADDDEDSGTTIRRGI